VKKCQKHLMLTAAVMMGCASLVHGGEPSLAKDLTSVIALLGLPCGEVVSVVHKGDNDNLATCKDGHRYHVFLNAEGRVVAQKQ
jgi:hypothetical protein